MRFFPLLDFQYVVLAVFLGLTALVLLVMAFRTYNSPRKEKHAGGHRENYPEGIESEDHPAPPILVFVVGSIVVWVLIYAIFVGVKGPTF